MTERLDWNANTIAEFRANQGRVGGTFEGAPMVLVHHRGRNSGREYVTPTMYLPHDTEPDSIYVFATKGGTPTNPDWYHNLTAAGDGSVERGTETYKVTVRELTGAGPRSPWRCPEHIRPGCRAGTLVRNPSAPEAGRVGCSSRWSGSWPPTC